MIYHTLNPISIYGYRLLLFLRHEFPVSGTVLLYWYDYCVNNQSQSNINKLIIGS